MKIAVVTSSNAAEMSVDDPILIDALQRAGHQAVLWRWDDPEVDWASVDIALIRSTWDYFTRMHEFVPWLQRCQSQVKFVNDAQVLLWNIDKHYLEELAEAGVSVLPTQIVEEAGLQGAIDRIWQAGDSAIVKPVVSGGSWGLHHLQKGERAQIDSAQGPWIVQPFVPSIATEGELSVILFAGEVSHGIRKTPKSGDIRVQREFGGVEGVETPSEEARALATAALQACPFAPMVARADMVMHQGRLQLMELELLEPELFFAKVPEAADRLAQAL